MRSSDVIVVVRKLADGALAEEAGVAAGWRKVIVHVLGEAGAPTPAQLRRVRRSPDLRKRRLPVLVWTATAEEENAWRMSGAYVARGKISRATLEKALREIASTADDWVESAGYVGPDRRRRRGWLSKPARRRLADEVTVEKQDKAMVDDSSFATHMRQLRHSAFGVAGSDRLRRAQFLLDANRTLKAAARSQKPHAVAAMESLTRYISAAGASGPINEELVERHLDIAEGPQVDAKPALVGVVAEVDHQIGLHAA
jgi:hypothetical protein